MDLAKLSTRIFFDIIPKEVVNNNKDTIVYCFAHNNLNIPLMAKKISNLNYNLPNYILDNKTLMSGVSSSDEVKEIYLNYELEFNLIPYDYSWINTKIESDVVLNWCNNNGKKNIIICAPIFHIVRAFMTMSSSLIDLNLKEKINIYSILSFIDDWNEQTITHQGRNINTFNNFIEIELKRIETYTIKGDIHHAKKIWDYILSRSN